MPLNVNVNKDGKDIKTITLSDANQDVDAEIALLTGAVLFARKDADTVIPIACDASGNLKIVLG